ncbi:MAG TPA: LacI family DNA-binding transcriptional regulator [Candidatus Sulfomarinibacteraceae bacterium]|nr:LacI family DNA-binding transcriptional regulator [Candidatus Sulfomarinibacteraceae bacterium]
MPVTLKDIARDVGVSITTVSRALAGYDDVADETRSRVEEAASRLGYSPNLTARRLQKQRTDTLGFIIPTYGARFSDPFFSEFIAGLGNTAADHHYDLLVSTHPPESERERKAYEQAVRGGWVDGLLVVRTRVKDSRVQLLCENGFPFVAFGRTDCNGDFPYVDEDSEAGMRMMVDHFAALGHRDIGLIAPPVDLMFGCLRIQGFHRAMTDNDLVVNEQWIVTGDMTQRSGAEAARRLLALESQPTAIIAGNDLMAIGAMSYLQQQGYEIPGDFAIGGFDDIPPAAHTNPPLTTIHQPIYRIARTICEMLIDLLNGRRPANYHVLLTPTLIERASSGSPRTHFLD